MGPLISVIVPIYNTQEYLTKCVQSVLDQTYQGFEILLVDDGSQDGSAEICRAFCGSDSRIRFLPLPHKGVSAARNAGMDEAKGEYLFFLDSDDTIHPQLLEALLELCETTGAALATEVYRHMMASDPGSPAEILSTETGGPWRCSYMDNAEVLRQFSSRENGHSFHGIGGKMVRSSAVGELRFDETLTNSEDTLFIYQLLETGLDAVILWEKWYQYWKHGRNISGLLTIRSCEDSYRCLKYICDQEWKRDKGPGSGVTFWTLVISARLRRAYVRSRQERNREVSGYLRKLAGYEARSDRFLRLSPKEKWKHHLAFRCYPLYLPVHRVSSWMWRMEEWKRRNQSSDR